MFRLLCKLAWAYSWSCGLLIPVLAVIYDRWILAALMLGSVVWLGILSSIREERELALPPLPPEQPVCLLKRLREAETEVQRRRTHR